MDGARHLPGVEVDADCHRRHSTRRRGSEPAAERGFVIDYHRNREEGRFDRSYHSYCIRGGLTVALLVRRLSLKAMENAQHMGVPNLIRYLGGWTPFPMGVVFSLTMRCNLACQMCPQVQMREETEYPELTLEQLEAVVDDLRASFPIRPLIHLIGGETLLRRDAVTLARHIKARGFQCSLTTNGVLLQRHAEELVGLGLDRINVSIDGPREVHDAVRGIRGAYDLAIAGIQALVAARPAGASYRPAITVNTVITG
ncbi:MAG TPA: radical SAM protein, partial [Thermoanaerobaculaceae bacterium]|nr:radical SAM protein [Thermoanaerobaculaceae bacterium]